MYSSGIELSMDINPKVVIVVLVNEWSYRYGILAFVFLFKLFSFRVVITLPNVNRLRLIFIRSRSRATASGQLLSFPALLAHSLPAKSTRCNFPKNSMSPSPSSNEIFPWTWMVKRQCDRDEALFILVSPIMRECCAFCMRLNTSAALVTCLSVRPLDVCQNGDWIMVRIS